MADDTPELVPGFELIEHTADVGVHAWGPRREDVFAQAARGMLSLVVDEATVSGRERYVVEVEAVDLELLLAAWLNELLYFVEGRGVVFSGEFEIELREPAVPGGGASNAPGAPRGGTDTTPPGATQLDGLEAAEVRQSLGPAGQGGLVGALQDALGQLGRQLAGVIAEAHRQPEGRQELIAMVARERRHQTVARPGQLEGVREEEADLGVD